MRNHPLLIVLLISLCILFIFFGEILLDPNNYLFGWGGDPLQQYFATNFYVKYDHGWMFSGMNYPYGEHINYTGNQPALAFLLNWWDDHLFPIAGQVIGIMNFIIIINFLLCPIFLFLVLKKMQIPNWWAVAAAILVAFISPQIDRISGHYSLTYSFYIPLIWWLLLRVVEENKGRQWIYLILLSLSVFVLSNLHLYYFPIAATFIAAFLFFYLLKYHKHGDWKMAGLLVLAVLLPFILISIITALTDPFQDRPESPYGIMYYVSHWEGVFLPRYNWLRDTFHVRHLDFEAYASVGLAGFVIFLYTLFRVGRYALRRNFRKMRLPALPDHLQPAFWGSVLVLLFSMGLPFKLGLEWLLDSLGPIKQLRGLGRFAWVFFYVFSVYAVVVIYQVHRKLRMAGKNFVAWGLIIAFSAAYALDAYFLLSMRSTQIKNQTDYFYDDFYPDRLAEAGLGREDFQAILPLPYYNLGSEKIYIINSGAAFSESAKAAFQTGIPIATIFAARSSVSRSYKLAQLLSHPLIQKDALRDLPGDKPFLVIRIHEDLNEREQYVLKQAKEIWGDEWVGLYSLPVSAFQDTIAKAWIQYQERKAILNFRNGYATDSGGEVIYKSFDSFSGEAFLGDAGFYQRRDKAVMFEGVLSPGEYEASIWVRSHRNRAALPPLYLDKKVDGIVTESLHFNPKFGLNIYQDWIRAELIFSVGKAEKIELYFDDNYIITDELLIRPLNQNVYTQPNTHQVALNNFILHDPGTQPTNLSP